MEQLKTLSELAQLFNVLLAPIAYLGYRVICRVDRCENRLTKLETKCEEKEKHCPGVK